MDVNIIDHPLSADVCDLFDGAYELMVQILGRLFAHFEENLDELKDLADTAVEMMIEVIEPLGNAVTLLPAGPSHPAHTAGPSFQLSRSAAIPTHSKAARFTFRERLLELAAYAQFLRSGTERQKH